jgi:hypothetical protein
MEAVYVFESPSLLRRNNSLSDLDFTTWPLHTPTHLVCLSHDESVSILSLFVESRSQLGFLSHVPMKLPLRSPTPVSTPPDAVSMCALNDSGHVDDNDVITSTSVPTVQNNNYVIMANNNYLVQWNVE